MCGMQELWLIFTYNLLPYYHSHFFTLGNRISESSFSFAPNIQKYGTEDNDKSDSGRD